MAWLCPLRDGALLKRQARRAAAVLLLLALTMIPRGLWAAEGALPQTEVDTPPKPIKREAPVYPYELARNDVAGYVEMDYIIDAEGRPRAIKVVHSNNPWLERSAINAVREWRFSPAIKGGKAVAVFAKQLIEFHTERSDGSPWQISKGKDHAKLPPELRWDTPPNPIWITYPIYPYESLVAKQAGQTTHRLLVDPAGDVIQIQQVEATTPEMGLAVEAMLSAWKFQPAKNEKGERCFATLTMKHSFKPTGRSDVPVTASGRAILALLDKDPEKIIPAKTLDHVPAMISSRKPVFPPNLKATDPEGEASIEFFIDQEGDVQLPRIASATKPEFGYAAAQAVMAWRFEPPLVGGKPVVTKLRAPVKFKYTPSAATPAQNP